MRKTKVLLADYDRVFINMLGDYLKRIDYEVYNAYLMTQVIDISQKEKPDVIICDLELSGIGVLENNILKYLSLFSPKTEIIILSAYPKEETSYRLLGKKDIRCLYKPIILKELESLLRALEEELNRQNRA